jgi:hypothetical protein
MRYMILIYNDPAVYMQMSPEAQNAEFHAYMAFNGEAQGRGVLDMRDAGQLQPVHTATTVRVRDGKTITTDGPFAETKEVLGGYYILDCPSLDVAIELAAKIPGATHGSVEVRPIFELPQ